MVIMEGRNRKINRPKISVIVPVYNTEEFLEQCLKSLREQTLKDIEIIVIDDASTDHSGEICDSYAGKDSRFRIIHNRLNKGLSVARNTGLKSAQAEYVMFLDSDDWVEPEFCEAPYCIAKESGADLVIFQFTRYKRSKAKQMKRFPQEGPVLKKVVFTEYWPSVAVNAWNKLYQMKLFCGIEYPGGKLCEDVAVTHRLVYAAERIYLINRYLYNHRDYRKGSISNNRSKQLVADSAYYRFKQIQDIVTWGYVDKSEEIIAAIAYLAIMGRDADLSTQCTALLQESSVGRGLQRTIPVRYKTMLSVYRISPRLFDFMCKVTNKRIS